MSNPKPTTDKPTTDELLAEGTVRQRKVAAMFLGVTDRQLGNWAKEPWFPKEARPTDGWNIPAIHKARETAGRKGSDESAIARELKQEKEREKVAQEKLKTEKMQREAAEDAGNVLDRDEYELAITESITVARDRLRSLPKDLARLAGDKRLRTKLIQEGTRIVDKILADLARQIETPPD